MGVSEVIRQGLPKWARQPLGASGEMIGQLVAASSIQLPASYLGLLSLINGGEGPLGIKPGWFVFWPAEEVVQNNVEYDLTKSLPGYFGFGSSGGGELFAFDMRNGEPWAVVMVPFIPLDAEEAITIATNFDTFLLALGRDEPDA